MHFLPKELRESYFFSQPHQPFFLIAFINAFVSMGVFALGYGGILSMRIDPIFFHIYALLFLLFTPAFAGFLLTTFPRFNATEPFGKENYAPVFTLYYVGSVLYLLGSIVAPLLSFLGLIASFGAHVLFFRLLLQSFKASLMPDMHDTFWILISVGTGLVAHLLFLGAFFYEPLLTAAKETGVWGYLFMVAFGVGQRMIPFFSHVNATRDDTLLKRLFALVIAHICLEIIYRGLGAFPDAVAAWLLWRRIRTWQLPFPNPNPLLWVLHIALFWTPVAFLFSAMEKLTLLFGGPSLMALGTHAMVLGFLFTVLVGFGTRVTIGHSGNVMRAGIWETVLFNLTQAVVVARLLLSVGAGFGWNIVSLFHLSVTLWLVTLALWAWRFFPVLIYGKPLS